MRAGSSAGGAWDMGSLRGTSLQGSGKKTSGLNGHVPEGSEI